MTIKGKSILVITAICIVLVIFGVEYVKSGWEQLLKSPSSPPAEFIKGFLILLNIAIAIMIVFFIVTFIDCSNWKLKDGFYFFLVWEAFYVLLILGMIKDWLIHWYYNLLMGILTIPSGLVSITVLTVLVDEYRARKDEDMEFLFNASASVNLFLLVYFFLVFLLRAILYI